MIHLMHNKTCAGKAAQRKNNGIRYLPIKQCIEDATNMLSLMDKITYTLDCGIVKRRCSCHFDESNEDLLISSPCFD